jgi:glycosyltransferase involved in cell wall biosynthesis
MLRKVLIPIEYSAMMGGMLRSVELLVRNLPRHLHATVVAPQHSEVAACMASAGAEVVETRGLRRWTLRKADPCGLLRTVCAVQQTLLPLVDDSTVLLTNHIGVELICGLISPLKTIPRVFVNRGHQYGGLSGRLLRHSLKSVSICIATTQYQRNTLEQELFVAPYRIQTIPNGVDWRRFQSCDTLPKPQWYRPGWWHIATVGFPSVLKNQELLIRSIAILRKHHGNILGLVIGSPGCSQDELYLGYLQSLVHELDLNSHIQFVPFQSDQIKLFSGIDILASTSVREGFGRTIIEAMAAGRPVVAVPAGGPECVIEHGKTGLLVEQRKAGPFACALQSVMLDSELKCQLIRCAAASVQEKYDAAKVADRYASVFTSLTTAPDNACDILTREQ